MEVGYLDVIRFFGVAITLAGISALAPAATWLILEDVRGWTGRRIGTARRVIGLISPRLRRREARGHGVVNAGPGGPTASSQGTAGAEVWPDAERKPALEIDYHGIYVIFLGTLLAGAPELVAVLPRWVGVLALFFAVAVAYHGCVTALSKSGVRSGSGAQ